MHGGDASLRPNINVGRFLNLLDQVVRHGAGERVAAHEHNYFFGEFGEMHSRLPGGVRSADDVHGFALARDGFRCAPAIVDASSLEAINAGHAESPPLNAHGEEKDMTGDFRAVGEFQVAIRAVDANAGDFLWSKNLDTKTLCLRHGAAGEVAASESGRKTQIIFDARAEAGLATGGFTFDDDGAQALAGAIDGRCKSGGATADNGEIVEISLSAGAEANLVGDGRERRLGETRAIGKQNEREGSRLRTKRIHEAAHFRVAFGKLDVNPLIRNLIARQKIAQLVRAIGPAGAEDADAFVWRAERGGPVVKQVVQRGIQLFFGRIPGLHEVIMDARFVDGVDGGAGVGVGS